MSNRTQRSKRSTASRLLELALWCTAGVFLGLVAWVQLSSWWTERRGLAELEELRPLQATARSVNPAANQPAPPQLEEGDLVARIEIPDAGVDAVALEGVEAAVLRRAVGHLPETSLPGYGGNVALAGHRDAEFRSLRHVEPGQLIRLTTPGGVFRYRVTRVQVVEPKDVWVVEDAVLADPKIWSRDPAAAAPTPPTGGDDPLAATSGIAAGDVSGEIPGSIGPAPPEEVLTLLTCYPFDYVGPAPRRWVVHAVRIDEAGPEAPPAPRLAAAPGG